MRTNVGIILALSFTCGAFAEDKLYWSDFSNIRRANLDGSSIEDIINGSFGYGRFEIDRINEKIYWSSDAHNRIGRANLDGSGVEELVAEGAIRLSGIALDIDRSRIYWCDDAANKIQGATLRGSELVDVVDIVFAGLNEPRDIAIDARRGKLYWLSLGDHRLRRCNLDGTEVEDLAEAGLEHPSGLELDLIGRKIYWIDYANSPDSGTIHRSNLDGSQLELLVAGLNYPSGLALDLTRRQMFWGLQPARRVQRAELTGENIRDIFSTGSWRPFRFAIDACPAGLGDLNCDGAIDAFDIEPFLMALFDPDAYAAAFPECDLHLGDLNGDGAVDACDIEPFIDLLFGP